MIWFLRCFFMFILVTMLCATSWASYQCALWKTPQALVKHPWFIATLFDCYFGFLTFYAWVFYKETGWFARTALWFNNNFSSGEFPYVILYIAMVYFFSYFWITVQVSPDDMSKQLKEHGSFIPGLRPGPRTAEYLQSVMMRITFVGAAFLGLIAVLPLIINKNLGVSQTITHFLGGTGLLIVVSVTLDFLQRIEANLLMRNYSGFLSGGEEIRGPRSR